MLDLHVMLEASNFGHKGSINMAGTSRCIKSLLWNTEHGACMMPFIREELHVGVQASFCRPGPLLSPLFKFKVYQNQVAKT